jgi:signal peptidase I
LVQPERHADDRPIDNDRAESYRETAAAAAPEDVDLPLVLPERLAEDEMRPGDSHPSEPHHDAAAARISGVATPDYEPPPQDFGLQLHFDTVAHDFNPPRQLTPETEPLALGGDAAEGRQPTSPSIRLAQVKEELVAWVKTLLSAAVYAILIVTFGFQVARVEGQSMAPTLEDQDRLIVNKAVYRISEPRRGDIVMLYYPLNPDKSFVKRVIAEEGDQVRIVDGRVYVNDIPVHDDYVPPQYRSHDEWGPQVIPEGYYFVMGDHRNNSSDSRTWGFVPKKYIIGKVQLRWWPVPTARVF